MSEIIYKYTDLEGAKKILGERTLKLSHYSDLNDPFDAYVHGMFGMDWNEVKQQSSDDIRRVLETDPDRLAKLTGCSHAEAMKVSQIYKGLAPEQKKQLDLLFERAEVNDAELQVIDRNQLVQEKCVHEIFETTSIFCATRTKDNLLMWAHYADKHRGVVFGLKPDVEKDSVLAWMRPVTYSDERPNFIDPSDTDKSKTSLERAEEAFYRVLYTKSAEWKYEQELRLAIPMTIPHGQRTYLMDVYPTEIVEVYLGCRLDASTQTGAEIISLAKKLNPDVKLYQTKTAKRSYDLNFQPI